MCIIFITKLGERSASAPLHDKKEAGLQAYRPVCAQVPQLRELSSAATGPDSSLDAVDPIVPPAMQWRGQTPGRHITSGIGVPDHPMVHCMEDT